jgi:hypothetical protein
VISLEFTDIGRDLSPYPFPPAYAQDDHERLLADKLHSQGAGVHWAATLTGFTQDSGEVRASLECDTARVAATLLRWFAPTPRMLEYLTSAEAASADR